MNLKTKLVVGAFTFLTSAGLFLFLSTPKTFAVTATSEQQLTALRDSLKTSSDKQTITGKLGSQNIVFREINESSAIQSAKTYTARNLDCDGEKATINSNTVAGNIAYMTASFKTGGSCSEPKRYNIGVNSTTKEIDGSIAPTTDSTADEEEADNCDARFNNPLSWGICPVIAMATDMSAFAFKNFIQPFLEENPISTHTDSTKTKENGIYIAWKSFRLIANILLVGTMLVVVYSTIKGSSR